MMNVMEISGVKAVIAFDPEINMFRGEFVGLNVGADFYATDIGGLRREGETSLKDITLSRNMKAERRHSPTVRGDMIQLFSGLIQRHPVMNQLCSTKHRPTI